MIFQTVYFLTQKTRNFDNQKARKHSSLSFSCQSDGKPTCDSFHLFSVQDENTNPRKWPSKSNANFGGSWKQKILVIIDICAALNFYFNEY